MDGNGEEGLYGSKAAWPAGMLGLVRASLEVFFETDEVHQSLELLSTSVISAMRDGGNLFFLGNGGSFADAQHFAGELQGRFLFDREPLPCFALGSNPAALTAIANDYSYSDIFIRELKASLTSRCVVIGLSTSGRSRNVLEALQFALTRSSEIWLLTGEIRPEIDQRIKTVCFPSRETPRIQEMQKIFGHLLCERVESELFGSAPIDSTLS